MGDETSTAPGGWLPRKTAAERAGVKAVGLVIAWSQSEPERVGQWATIPDQTSVLGRGAGEDDSEARVVFGCARPGAAVVGRPLTSRGLSRRQLALVRKGSALEMARVGRGQVLVNGRVVEKAPLHLSDVIMIENELVLLVAERDLRELGGGASPAFVFGQADPDGIVGESPTSFRLRDEIAFLASRGEHTLVLGPSGAGKEVCARAIHRQSKRAAGPFVARNAATLPPGLIDAELFGNARNFPSTGMRERRGIVGEAHLGTLFLDEIGELPSELQAHLLRLLDAGEYHSLGEDKPRVSDLRLLSATNREPETLKHDLLARLKLRLAVPGLNDRREDIPLLVRHLLQKLMDASQRARFFDPSTNEPRISPDLVVDLLLHSYTTHVRELESMLLVALGDSREAFIDTSDRVRALVRHSPALIEVSDETIRETLSREGGNVSAAWRALGFSSRDALNRVLKKRGIKPKP